MREYRSGRNYVTHWNSEINTPENTAFLALIRQAEPDREIKPDAVAALGYDAIHLLFDAIRSAGADDPKAIRDALSAIRNHPGATGTLSFGPSRDPRKDLS